jgi:hypothetical protein
MGITTKQKGKSVFTSVRALNVSTGTVACNGTAEATFTHTLGVIPTAYRATGVGLGSCIPVFKAVPTSIGGTLYSVGTGTISWMVEKGIGQ